MKIFNSRSTAALIGASVLTSLTASPASAQDAADMQRIIELCKEAPTEGSRIACLERAILQLQDGPQSTAGSLDNLGRPSASSTQAQESRGLFSRLPGSGLFGGRDETSAASADAQADGIGSEQVNFRNQTREEVERSLQSASGLRVARYGIVPYKKLVVELENGQVWRQINGDRQEVSVNLRRNQTVSITQSRISGYKMSLNEIDRTIRVERVR